MTTYSVSSKSQLSSVLSKVKGGDTVKLAGGEYGTLTLDGNQKAGLKAAGNITFVSASKNNPAEFSNVVVKNAKNVTFDNLKFDWDGQSTGKHLVHVTQSSGITIKNSDFEGQRVSGYGTKQGLQVSKSSGISVSNNEFSDFHDGATFMTVNNLTVRNNEMHSMAKDAMRYAGVKNVVIEKNYIHDMKAPVSQGHRDMIQFWTQGTEQVTSNVTIRGNVLDVGINGKQIHSIFMFNEEVSRLGAGKNKFYQDIKILDNHIQGNHAHGITVGEVNGVVVSGNTLVQKLGNKHTSHGYQPRVNIDDDSVNVRVTNNITHRVPDDEGASWVISNNKIVPLSYKASPPSSGTGISGTGGNSSAGNGAGNGGKQPPVVTPDPQPSGPDAGGNSVVGNNGNNQLTGNNSGNSLSGNGGVDKLRGLGGNDILDGGFSRDVLIGGKGADVFVFDSIHDTVKGARDIIRGGDGAAAFEGAGRASGDLIDLSAIDANMTKGGNQAFKFGGTGTGSVQVSDLGSGHTIVRANVDRDAEFEVQFLILDGGVRASAYTADDFIL